MTKSEDLLPHSISARCINRDWFGMSMDQVWEIMEDYLYFVSHAYNLRIYCFVLMSNHFHLIASAQSEDLSRAMQYLLANSSRRITKCAGRINHTWRANHFKRLIGTPNYYLHAYKYFYRNPVEAKIVSRVEDYPFSTLRGLLGFNQLVIPVCCDHTLFNDVEGTLGWLNEKPADEDRDAVRRALRRKEFTLPRAPGGGLHRLERERY